MSDSFISFLKAMADSTRLNILGLLIQEPRSVVELAATLDLRAPTISHHLNKLQKVGLVESKNQQYYSIYSVQSDKLEAYVAKLSPAYLVDRILQSQSVNQEAFQYECLARWIKNNKLTALPTQIKQRELVLQWLVEKFEQDRRYDWDQVGEIVGRGIHWGDPHLLDITRAQRALIDAGLLNRLPDESWYWRADSPLAQRPAFLPEELPIAESPDLLRYTAVRAALRAKDPSGVYANLEAWVEEKDPHQELLKIAVRIRARKYYTQRQIDKMIEKHHGGDSAVVRAALIENGIIKQSEDGTYVRITNARLP